MNFSSDPSKWLGPVWIISNYGSAAQAPDLADRGSLNEYYHPDTGVAISHKGFVNWNLLAVEMI